ICSYGKGYDGREGTGPRQRDEFQLSFGFAVEGAACVGLSQRRWPGSAPAGASVAWFGAVGVISVPRCGWFATLAKMSDLDAGGGARLFLGCAPTRVRDGDAARWLVVILAWRIAGKPQIPPSLSWGQAGVVVGVLLIISGNLSFLNWLTMVPSIACFDDVSLGFLFSSRPGGVKQRLAQMQLKEATGEQLPLRYGCYVRKVVNISFGLLIAYLSVPVVLNLLNSRQVMNTSFHPLRIVNTYGAFGSITKERTEVVLQGTSSLDPNDPTAVWEEYDFKCKPGDLRRRPCFITPYHYRLDWLMWFAAFQTYEQNEWIIHLAGKLLAQEEETLSLMATNPFEGRAPPRWVRGEHFKYKFSQPGGKHASEGRWWIRKRIGPYFPPVNLQGLKKFYEDRNWPYPVRD
ncbi:PREDICTED: lipase maturation factor 1-like, partial [Chlamydotis macqueenii]